MDTTQLEWTHCTEVAALMYDRILDVDGARWTRLEAEGKGKASVKQTHQEAISWLKHLRAQLQLTRLTSSRILRKNSDALDEEKWDWGATMMLKISFRLLNLTIRYGHDQCDWSFMPIDM